MNSEDEESARRRAKGAKLDANLARGIETVGPTATSKFQAATEAAWDLDWLMPRLIGP